MGTTTAAVSVVSIASSSRMRQCAAWKLLNKIWKTSPVDRVRVRLTANSAYMMTINDIGMVSLHQEMCLSFNSPTWLR